MKTKVIEFSNSMYDGGAETLVKDYACLIDKKKFDLSILCIYKLSNTANAKRIKDNKVRLESIYPNHSMLWRIHRKLFGEKYIPYKIKRYIEKEKPDVIHIHQENLKYFKKISKSLKGIRLYYTCHLYPDFYLGKNMPEEHEAAEYLIKHNNLQIIALHHQMAGEINRMFHIKNTVVIRNGVDFKRFRGVAESKDALRKHYGIPKEAFVIGNIGRMSPQKNQLFVLDVLDELIKNNKNVLLILIGSGPLEKQINEQITKKGLVNNVMILSNRTDIPELLKIMDVFVFPSLWEGLSVTLVEAQVAGLRCVVSDRINEETILLPTTVSLPIDEGPKIWKEAILNPTLKTDKYGDIEDFDMNREIKHLEHLYLGEEMGD